MSDQLTPFLTDISRYAPNLSQESAKRAAEFAVKLYEGNKSQNLTRIPAEEFVTGHLIDVLELLKFESLGERVMDIGSGCGVPGLLAAAIDNQTSRRWILVESEKQKAVFLLTCAEEMGLSDRVEVHADRAEKVIQVLKPDTVVARAVGPIDRIAAWIWNCSTWNNLILFKSRGWDLEWSNAQNNKYGKKLTITQKHEYGTEGKSRILVSLKKIKNG